MTLGEKLLELTAEYQRAVAGADWPQYGGKPEREPAAIAAEYEATVRELLTH